MKSGSAAFEDVGVAGEFDGGGLAPFGIFGLGTRFPRGGGVASVMTGSTFDRRV